ncbi:MAG TPA: alpha/beta hydrolase-fold protein [Gemmatimonadaceae bacterium]|nr:alpha/beta hydrolase-fold protein [Gemmatimonadaceae bacterium]
MRHRLRVVAAGLLAFGGVRAGAQSSGTLDEIGYTIPFESKVLDETRQISISLPRTYASNTERYPVLVVLDGEFEHEIAASIARFYAATSMLPPTIVIGVRNTDRMRDMTTKPAAGFTPPGEAAASPGGADRFLAFLADELLPYVDRTYRTAPMRVLVGHSLGGLFALYALSQRPAAFTGYIVMEPAIWWNNELEFRAARDVVRSGGAPRARVMLVNTRRTGLDTISWGGDRPMVRELTIAGESHASMAAQGMLLALRTMFSDFRPSDWRPGTRPIAMLDRFDSLAARVGYAVPIPAGAYERAIRMSIHARDFDDASRALDRMERSVGTTAESRALRSLLAEERAMPVQAGFIPLTIPARRPAARDGTRFLGRWVRIDDPAEHVIDVSASGDTIVVHDRIRFPDGSFDEGDHQVIQLTDAGTLEWGLPWFRGIAALLVLKGQLQPDGTLRVTREPRGWVPRGPTGDMMRTEIFRRVP